MTLELLEVSGGRGVAQTQTCSLLEVLQDNSFLFLNRFQNMKYLVEVVGNGPVEILVLVMLQQPFGKLASLLVIVN